MEKKRTRDVISIGADANARNVAPDSCLTTLYGNSVFAKRRHKVSPTGIWFAVMFARNKEDGSGNAITGSAHSLAKRKPGAPTAASAERTRITCTSHIGSLFVNADATASAASVTSLTNNRWRVVLALGPMRDETDANGVCRLWSLCQRGVISKAARGEAICIRFGIPGFVDWDSVLGYGHELAELYRLQFCRNPCLLDDDARREKEEEEETEILRKRRIPQRKKKQKKSKKQS